jgi:beta-galactosidase
VRPEITDNSDYIVADAKPTEALEAKQIQAVLKPWILPTGNKFISEMQKRHIRPEGNPGNDFPFVQGNFDDSRLGKSKPAPRLGHQRAFPKQSKP